MSTLNDTTSILHLLHSRRSASAKAMAEPGPTAEQLREILACGVRVPDHGKLAPWRFIVFEGEARARFGEVMKARWQALNPTHGEGTLEFVRKMFLRAPTIVAVVSTAAPHPKIPEYEQLLSAAAVCQNMLLAATALGVGCQWNTDWMAYDGETAKAMGLAAHEKVAGLIYLGTATEPYEDRPRPDPEALTTRWAAP
jgi:nitroreductase